MFRCVKNIATGAVVGAVLSAIVLPQLDRRQQRTLKRLSRRACNMAGDTYDNIRSYIK